ncbi:hypothetical protein [Aestuariivivens marinum]|uniref:hypothetical protein n=1 Tax=Aestuariivivens marinum TaxID=2913555 RepID=UPI001F58BE9B|nr:hypothetical protein [Aestuariivivens marinum]
MKKLLLFTVSIIMLNCSNNDDTSKTFLELYGGTAWAEDELGTNNILIYRFINNTNTPYEEWAYYFDFDCAQYSLMTSEITDDYISGTYIVNRIIDNSNKLVIEYIDPMSSLIHMDTFTITGETMTVKQEIPGVDSETFTYTRYNQNVDDINICN